MRLDSIKYSEFEHKAKEWDLDKLTLDQVTLIVGKNAGGKTRALNVINNLARLIRGEIKPTTHVPASYDAHFKDNNDVYRYSITLEDNHVVEEKFDMNNKELLLRGKDGVGKIFTQQLKKAIDFQTPPSELALTLRRDNIQHPFFEPLYEWASSVFHYAFGRSLGQDTFGLFRKNDVKIDPKVTTAVVPIYRAGEKEFNSDFKNAIKSDLKKLGYYISDIGLAPPSRAVAVDPTAGELAGLWVHEEGLKGKIEQEEISQGMFRALSLIIQLNYSVMALKPASIIIDDIGEGLDFERSCALVSLLLEKVKGTNTQLIMATNDRFIMNNVPLEMWTVLIREGSHCKVINIHNAKEKFEKFRFTGLNNFDFFATDFLNKENK